MKQILLLIAYLTIHHVTCGQGIDTSYLTPGALSKRIDSTRRMDSLRRMDLLEEIRSLKGTRAATRRLELEQKLKEADLEDSLRKVQQQNQLKELKASAKGFPVTLFRDTVLLVYTRIGSFTASDRSKAIAEKIKALYHDAGFSPDSLIINQGEAGPQIVYKDVIVMSINEMEALWIGVSQDSLATRYLARIQNAVREEREAKSVVNIALRIGAILAILGGIYFVIRLINVGFRKI